MNIKRYWYTFRLWTIFDAPKRTEYIKKKGIFKEIGSNVSIMERKVPLYGNLIKIHNNVHIASHVSFVTHDIAHIMLNGTTRLIENGQRVHEKVGCIEICDNVFVGANSTILYNVKIGSNVIVGGGSLVNKDIPDNSVVAGVPARVIGKFDDFVNKRINEEIYPEEPQIGRFVSPVLEEWLWKRFEENRE